MALEPIAESVTTAPSIRSQPPQQPPPTQQPRKYEDPRLTGEFVPYHQYARANNLPFDKWQAPEPQYLIPGTEPQPKQPRVPTNPVWEKSKIGVHCADIVLCIIALGISFSIIGRNDGGIVIAAGIPILVIALLWDIADLITRHIRGLLRGIHPGAHVAMNLLLWIACIIMGAIEAAILGNITPNSLNHHCWDHNPHRNYYYSDDDLNCRESIFHGKQAAFTATTAFTLCVFVMHFVLFVGACVDTARRNRAGRRDSAKGTAKIGGKSHGWRPMSKGKKIDVPEQSNIPLQSREASSAAVQEVKNEAQVPATHGLKEYFAPEARRV